MAQRSTIGSRLTRGALGLIIVTSAMFLLLVFAPAATRSQVIEATVLTPTALRDLQLWKLATTALVNPQALGFILDVLMLWMFVPTLERWWGTRRFFIFVAATLLAGHLVAALVGMGIGQWQTMSYGLGPFIWGAIVAFGVLFANQPVQLFGVVPIKGRSLAIGAVVLMSLMVLIERHWMRGAAAFTGMGVAWLMTSGGFTPRTWLLKWRRGRAKRSLGVLQGGRTPGKPKAEPPKKWVN